MIRRLENFVELSFDFGIFHSKITMNPFDFFLNYYQSFQLTDENLKFLGLLVVISFLLILILGISKTVIIYRDYSDLTWSMAVLVVPLITFLGLTILLPDPTPDQFDMFWGGDNQKIFSSIGLGGTAFSILMMLRYSVSSNGFVLGPIIFAFKLLASGIVLLVAFGVIGNLFSRDRSIKTVLVTMIVFGFFMFILRHLVNGDSVLAKRGSNY